jgi:hypothetical protein
MDIIEITWEAGKMIKVVENGISKPIFTDPNTFEMDRATSAMGYVERECNVSDEFLYKSYWRPEDDLDHFEIALHGLD